MNTCGDCKYWVATTSAVDNLGVGMCNWFAYHNIIVPIWIDILDQIDCNVGLLQKTTDCLTFEAKP